jgi:hypothetical protein
MISKTRLGTSLLPSHSGCLPVFSIGSRLLSARHPSAPAGFRCGCGMKPQVWCFCEQVGLTQNVIHAYRSGSFNIR